VLVHATVATAPLGTGSCWAGPNGTPGVPGCGRWRAPAASVPG
jgi:hypothetical protein